LTAEGKREARVARGAFLADAADIDIAAAAWNVRARLRDRFVELESSRAALASIEAQVAARREAMALVDRRVQAGMVSALELGTQRWQLAQLELARDREAARAQRALGELAQALGLPLDVVGAMDLRFEPEPPEAVEMGAAELRRLALRNRLDVHRKLLEFGAADAEVKLAVAGQNPDITLGPGYTWDQGDNVWSLAVGFSIPSGARTQAAIREAEAQRELAAQQFQATQIAALAAAEGAAAQYRSARGRVAAAQRQAQLQREQEARIVRQFDAGAADRLQRVTARIDLLTAQDMLREARTESTRALAQLEDAVQRPLFGDVSVLPDMRAAKLPELSE
jgi:outer membrane protein TolC